MSINDPAQIRQIVRAAKRVAVIGIKTEAQRGQPAFDVPAYLDAAGLEVIPVPVYYPEVQTILGKPVFRDVRNIPGEIDIAILFRRSEDVAKHTEELIAKKPKVVWMQTGITNAEVAKLLSSHGISVIEDRCFMMDHRAARIFEG